MAARVCVRRRWAAEQFFIRREMGICDIEGTFVGELVEKMFPFLQMQTIFIAQNTEFVLAERRRKIKCPEFTGRTNGTLRSRGPTI
jgi:hypothetical protein